ncbi:SDR family NAD(P)-dependent oxidoreductase, partial [Nocardia gipuzkoensis]
LCPGFVHTEFHRRAGIEVSSLPKPLWLGVDRVVAGSLRDLEKNRVISVPGVQYKALTAVAGLLPRSVQGRLNRGIFNASGRV